MANEDSEKTCAHPGCSCLMQEEEDYCSDFCESHPDTADCGCGHLACTSRAAEQG